MYANKLVAAIRVNGKVLREFKDTVYLKFGSEYSILLKNLNSVRANINIYIDGDNIVPGGLVLNAGQEIDLQRAIRNGNLSEGNTFRFIERTGNIEDHRGIKLEDGLIKIDYQFEKVYQRQDGIHWNNIKLGGGYPYYGDPTPYYGTPFPSKALRSSKSSGVCGQSVDTSYMSAMGSVTSSMSAGATLTASSAQAFNAAPQNETGITVPGSKSEQKFVTVSDFVCESEKFSIVLKLLGETPDNEVVRNPITVKSKPKCVTCGKQNKAASKFCSECGTALEIFA